MPELRTSDGSRPWYFGEGDDQQYLRYLMNAEDDVLLGQLESGEVGPGSFIELKESPENADPSGRGGYTAGFGSRVLDPGREARMLREGVPARSLIPRLREDLANRGEGTARRSIDKEHGEGAFDALPWQAQRLALDVQFQTRNPVAQESDPVTRRGGGFPNMVRSLIAGDYARALDRSRLGEKGDLSGGMKRRNRLRREYFEPLFEELALSLVASVDSDFDSDSLPGMWMGGQVGRTRYR